MYHGCLDFSRPSGRIENKTNVVWQPPVNLSVGNQLLKINLPHAIHSNHLVANRSSPNVLPSELNTRRTAEREVVVIDELGIDEQAAQRMCRCQILYEKGIRLKPFWQ